MLGIVGERRRIRIPEVELAAPVRERAAMRLRVGEQTVVAQQRRRVFVRR